MKTINNPSLDEKLNGKGWFVKKFLTSLSIYALFTAPSFGAKTKTDTNKDLNKVLTTNEFITKSNHSNIPNVLDFIDKEWVAEEYLENNLYIKGKLITNEEFAHSITKIDKDIYQIKYSHEFEWIPNFSEASSRDVTINVKFSYKNNNIYIEFSEIKIWWYALQDNWTLVSSNTVYDYDISQWVNKSIEINSKVNPHKTLEMIKNKIKEYNFSFSWQLENIKEFENTQLTKLNDIALWEEVMKEWEFYYREVFLTEKWQYRPIAKIYFDKYGVLDQNKTSEELKNIENLVLWTKVSFNKLDLDNKNIEISISKASKENLKEKVKDHRQQIINIIDKAKVGPNLEFKWFNKINSKRVWSDKEEWLFDTKLISLELIDDTYVFQRWDKTQAIYFGVENKDWEKDNIFLKNTNNQKVEDFFVTINNNYYKITLKDSELAIYKIQKEELNIENNLPIFSWDKTLANILNAKDINTYYNANNKSLEYRTNDWNLTTNIPCEKSEKWEYKLEKTSTNIDIQDLYNYPEFKTITKDVTKIQKKLNILDIDILNSFQSLLAKEWIKLNNKSLVKIIDKKGIAHYCIIKQTKNGMQVDLDTKLYKDVEKTLKK